MNEKFSGFKSNKKLIAFTIFVMILFLINIIAGILIYSDIQVMNSPETTVEVKLIEINSNEAIFQTKIDIKNTNSFDLIVSNLHINAIADNTTTILEVNIDGGKIKANEKEIFESTEYIEFDGEVPKLVKSKVSGNIGIEFLGIIKKTIPLKINVITDFGNSINEISAPILHITSDIEKISDDGINFTSDIDIYNPNSFDLEIQDINVQIITEQDEIVGSMQVFGQKIPAKTSEILKGNGQVIIEAFNAKTLYVDLSTQAGAKIAGIEKYISIESDIKINMPDLTEVFDTSSPTDIFIKTDIRATLNGFMGDVYLDIINPNNISLVLKDTVVYYYDVKGDDRIEFAKCDLNDTIVAPQESLTLQGEISLPFKNIILSKISGDSDWLLVVVRTNITIPGLDFAMWAGVGGYQDLHLLK